MVCCCASAMGWLESRAGVRHSLRALEIVRSPVLTIPGLYMHSAHFFFVAGLAAKKGPTKFRL